jgi:hypothetical protein
MGETLCRTGNHWCIECCERRPCPVLLGPLPDGSVGCTGHATNPTADIREPDLCVDFNCLTLYGYTTDREIQEIRRIITALPPGKFSMSQVFQTMERHSPSPAA